MGTDDRKRGLLASLARSVKRSHDNLRQAEPHRFVSSNDGHMFVENVAQMLGCSVDTVRRIPRSELPASKPGKRVLYLKEDVIDYIRQNHDVSSARVTFRKQQEAAPDKSEPFDPVAMLRKRSKRGADNS